MLSSTHGIQDEGRQSTDMILASFRRSIARSNQNLNLFEGMSQAQQAADEAESKFHEAYAEGRYVDAKGHIKNAIEHKVGAPAVFEERVPHVLHWCACF